MINVANISKDIAVELGNEWRVEPGIMADGSDAYLQGPEQIRIRVSKNHHKRRGRNRLFLSEAVAGDLGKFVRSGLVISVSRDRTIEDMAADIRRRLLPGVEDAIRKARVDKTASDARDAEHAAMRDIMAKTLDGRTYTYDENNVRFGSYGDGVSGSVEVRKFGEDVKFEVKVPKALAPAMADTLAELSKADTPSETQPAPLPAPVPEADQPTAGVTKRRGRRKPLTPEERKERVDALQSRLDGGIAELADDDRWAAFLRAAQDLGNAWSFNNLMLITLQAAERGFTPSIVKTVKAWNELGRKIKTGEKALYIFEPIKYRLSLEEAQKEGKGGFDSDGKPRMTIRGVRPSPRFDISQTDGEPVPLSPTPPTLTTDDDIAGAWEAIASQIRATGYNVVGGPPGQLNSYTDPRTREVWVCDTLDDASATMSAIHELAHILLNHVDDPDEYRQHRGQIEAEAQSVVFIVAGAIGLNTAPRPTPNVGNWWEGDTELLAGAAERVATTAQQIIRAVHDPAPAN